MPILNVTEELRATLSREFVKVTEALATLSIHFDREVRSSAIAEVSESLVAKHINGVRTRRASLGHDVQKDHLRIEVKSRLRGKWGDAVQFNFGAHTANADEAYALAWDWEEIGSPSTPQLFDAYKLPVKLLMQLWPVREQTSYCARTNLRRLRNAWQL